MHLNIVIAKDMDDSSNPNGSLNNIAGSLKKNILGMMPHPERMVDKLLSNEME